MRLRCTNVDNSPLLAISIGTVAYAVNSDPIPPAFNAKPDSLAETTGRWTFIEGDLDSDDVQNLLAIHLEQMRSSSPADACHVLPLKALRDPAITFWSLREGDRLLAVGALKTLNARHGEVKSMRTASNARGRGAGAAMLEHILTQARSRGYTRVSLETGTTEPFEAALRLYGRHGFRPCGAFAEYQPSPFTRFMTREL